MKTATKTKSVRRDWLLRQARAGNLVSVGSYHFDDQFGTERRDSGALPVRIIKSNNEFVEGECNLRASDFDSSCGHATQNPDGTIWLYVHSNCNYTFRLKSEAPPAPETIVGSLAWLHVQAKAGKLVCTQFRIRDQKFDGLYPVYVQEFVTALARVDAGVLHVSASAFSSPGRVSVATDGAGTQLSGHWRVWVNSVEGIVFVFRLLKDGEVINVTPDAPAAGVTVANHGAVPVDATPEGVTGTVAALLQKFNTLPLSALDVLHAKLGTLRQQRTEAANPGAWDAYKGNELLKRALTIAAVQNQMVVLIGPDSEVRDAEVLARALGVPSLSIAVGADWYQVLRDNEPSAVKFWREDPVVCDIVSHGEVFIEVPRRLACDLLSKAAGTTIARTREYIARATPERLAKLAAITLPDLDGTCRSLVKVASDELQLSPRELGLALKTARSIAAIDGQDVIHVCHLSEAIQYRDLTRR